MMDRTHKRWQDFMRFSGWFKVQKEPVTAKAVIARFQVSRSHIARKEMSVSQKLLLNLFDELENDTAELLKEWGIE